MFYARPEGLPPSNQFLRNRKSKLDRTVYIASFVRLFFFSFPRSWIPLDNLLTLLRLLDVDNLLVVCYATVRP
jgi:hypothetical protein